VDEIEPILDVAPDETLTQDQFDTLRSQDAVAELLRSSTAARRFRRRPVVALGAGAADESRTAAHAPCWLRMGETSSCPPCCSPRVWATSIDPLPLEYCEGVRVCFEAGRPVALERLRADQ